MTQIANRILSLAPSATLAMSQKVAELKAAGLEIINLSIGEPDFPTPMHIKEAAKRAIDEDFSHYTPVAGYLSTRHAAAEKLKRENGLSFSADQIVIGNGAKHELTNAIMATINPGDEVIIPMPAWVSYVEMVKLAEGAPVCVVTNVATGFKLTPEMLSQAITPRTRMLIICSPSNPTGAVYSRSELEALAEVLVKHPDITILSDEIYEHISYLGAVAQPSQLPQLKERVMVVNGVSKAYAMTGWRIGFIAAPLSIAKAIVKLQGQYTSAPSSIAQKAAEAAWNGPQECVEKMRSAFQRRRDLICSLASEVKGWRLIVPEGAFYIFPDVSALLGLRTPKGDVIASSADYVMYLLEEAGVACVDGAAFGSPGYIRLSYATSSECIKKAMGAIKIATVKLT